MISLKESILKTNASGSSKYFFTLYKDPYEDPRIEINFMEGPGDALDKQSVDKEYRKIPQSMRIPLSDIKNSNKRHLTPSGYTDDWKKLTNIILCCKSEKEIKKTVEKLWNKDKYSSNNHVEVRIDSGHEFTSVGKITHDVLEGASIIHIYIMKRSIVLSKVRDVTDCHLDIVLYDKKDQGKVGFWL